MPKGKHLNNRHKKDFSCSDRKFASNCGVGFHTPEEFFDGSKKIPFNWLTPDPSSMFSKSFSASAEEKSYVSKDQEMVVMVGFPASGKSTFCKKHFGNASDYLIVNRDSLKTQDKCLAAAENALKSGKSVIVDNTNPCQVSRKAYIDLAKRNKVSNIRCFHLTTTYDAAQHLNFYRQASTKGKLRRIPDVGYNVFKSRFVEPHLNEGFTDVKQISLALQLTDDEKDAFLQWYT